MIKFSAPSRRAGRLGEHGRPRALRVPLTLPVLSLLAAAGILLTPALAGADTSSTLTVVGTSDVSDSGLIPNLIQPAFHAAYPQFNFEYIGTNTFKAIKDAESGVMGPSVLIVHAASLENQFVAGGYSYNNQYGNAIFRDDFVLAGPVAPDTAGVSANAANNIVQAFEDVATAGYNGGSTTPAATFVARDSASGTSSQSMRSGHWSPSSRPSPRVCSSARSPPPSAVARRRSPPATA